MIPGRRLLGLTLLLALLGLVPAFFTPLQPAWLTIAGLLILMALVDAVRGWRPPRVDASRLHAGAWSQGRWRDSTLTLMHTGGRPLQVAVFDHYPSGWEMAGLPHALQHRLEAGSASQISYRLRPLLRGNHQFGRIELRIDSPWGLWQRRQWTGEPEAVRVFPDFARILHQSIHATDTRTQGGVLRRRRRGEGTDFHQLREYRQGDSLRAIDWKATARFQKPISREYQEERDQQIIFLLDCSRRMQAMDDERSHFDHALDAMLLLGWTAQKQGDAIGVYAFGGVERWLPPHKGRVAIDRLLEGVYDLQPTLATPDYLTAVERVLEKARKRSFVVLLTNLRDEDEDTLASSLQLLSERHLTLCASLREIALDQAVRTPVTSFEDAIRHAGTLDYLRARCTAMTRLSLRTRELLDVTPQELPTALVNNYLKLKESGQL
ncbi:DUF58 domain-containing protein [Chitinilyticum aquatile]|uniref:DUF58 domain-containing protein n=1 Tax=Chitinilyticum aquatile TaxID=362520 RepID=UPI00040A445A|nr:DUF58 domain-containing protein [Chitinilyticum aquatile]